MWLLFGILDVHKPDSTLSRCIFVYFRPFYALHWSHMTCWHCEVLPILNAAGSRIEERNQAIVVLRSSAERSLCVQDLLCSQLISIIPRLCKSRARVIHVTMVLQLSNLYSLIGISIRSSCMENCTTSFTTCSSDTPRLVEAMLHADFERPCSAPVPNIHQLKHLRLSASKFCCIRFLFEMISR